MLYTLVLALPIILLLIGSFIKSKSIIFKMTEDAKNNQKQIEDLKASLILKEQNAKSLEAVTLELRLAVEKRNFELREMERKLGSLEQQLTLTKEFYTASDEKRKEYEVDFLTKAKTSIEQLSKGLIEEAQNQNKEITKDIIQKFELIGKNIAQIYGEVNQNKSSIKVIESIFSNSSSTGKHSETILENTLIDLGFRSGVDYIRQFSSSDGKARPDFVIFLPEDSVLIVDSKSSEYFLKDSDLSDEERMKKIKDSMNRHLNDLSGRDYIESIRLTLQKPPFNKKVKEAHLFMFLPSELAIEKVVKADFEFYSKARSKKVYICGPVTFEYALAVSRYGIQNYKINEQYEGVIKEVAVLIERVRVLSEYADAIIKNYNQMGKSISDFQGSFNSRIIPIARKIEEILPESKGKEKQVKDVSQVVRLFENDDQVIKKVS